ncbi:hypothetical protein RHO14_07190 [Orbus wheelerorum]|uniref:hypothetical protein n=1 Tax=Orbus wheelerorum TaxID=3074111 RepID=UPI00370D57F0
MIEWTELVNALGKSENSIPFLKVKKVIGEKPKISEDPIEYNDPETSKYYKFILNGIEFTIIDNNVKQIHLYLTKNQDGYNQYCGELPSGIELSTSSISVIDLLGQPTLNGGGKDDKLLGYINKWIAYYVDDSYSLRFEFSPDDKLSAVTLTTLPI